MTQEAEASVCIHRPQMVPLYTKVPFTVNTDRYTIEVTHTERACFSIRFKK